MKRASKINFRNVVEDKTTGFKGVVVARVEYDTGCIQYGVRPRMGEDGKMPKVEYLDEGDIRVLTKTLSVSPVKDRTIKEKKGGPSSKVPRS